jgi:hypothetical protein
MFGVGNNRNSASARFANPIVCVNPVFTIGGVCCGSVACLPKRSLYRRHALAAAPALKPPRQHHFHTSARKAARRLPVPESRPAPDSLAWFH